MTQWLEPVFGPNWSPIMTWLIWAILIVLALWALLRLYRSTMNARVRRGWNGDVRLEVIDATPIDDRRRLVLVRRDDVEHLIVIGGYNDLVVESGIARKEAEKAEPVSQPTAAPTPKPGPKPANPQPAPKRQPQPAPIAARPAQSAPAPNTPPQPRQPPKPAQPVQAPIVSAEPRVQPAPRPEPKAPEVQVSAQKPAPTQDPEVDLDQMMDDLINNPDKA